jgi:hypothetical protein
MPDRIKRLPISRAGFPVPWFVAWIDGEPDFRVIGQGKMVQAVNRKLCWACGQSLGVHKAFLIGPMCSITRSISEPPMHFECADYCGRACPFLSHPNAQRNKKDLPEERHVAGIPIMRNPGAVCVWVTKTFKVFNFDGVMFDIGEPERTVWLAEGRNATRAEVERSIESGLPILMAAAEAEGKDAVDELLRRIEHNKTLLPKE